MSSVVTTTVLLDAPCRHRRRHRAKESQSSVGSSFRNFPTIARLERNERARRDAGVGRSLKHHAPLVPRRVVRRRSTCLTRDAVWGKSSREAGRLKRAFRRAVGTFTRRIASRVRAVRFE